MSASVKVAFVILMVTSTAWGRTWTDSTGKFTLEAKFIEVKDRKVTIEKEDGKRITLPLIKLSNADREYVEKLANAALKEELIKDIKAAFDTGSAGETSAQTLLLEKTAVEKVIEKYAGKKVTIRWPILDVTEESDGEYRLSLGGPDMPPGLKFRYDDSYRYEMRFIRLKRMLFDGCRGF